MSHARALGTVRPWRGAASRPRRRSRLIDALRVLLPLLALVLVGLVLAWPQIMRDSGGIGVPTLVPGDGDQPDMLRMDSPRYVGQTSSERPYEVTARAASLDPLQANIVHLDQPSADIALADDGKVRLMAETGTYDRDTERLVLDGGIEVVTSSGYRFVTPSARVNLAQGLVRGWQSIEGARPRRHALGQPLRDPGRGRRAALRWPRQGHGPAAGGARDAARRGGDGAARRGKVLVTPAGLPAAAAASRRGAGRRVLALAAAGGCPRGAGRVGRLVARLVAGPPARQQAADRDHRGQPRGHAGPAGRDLPGQCRRGAGRSRADLRPASGALPRRRERARRHRRLDPAHRGDGQRLHVVAGGDRAGRVRRL